MKTESIPQLTPTWVFFSINAYLASTLADFRCSRSYKVPKTVCYLDNVLITGKDDSEYLGTLEKGLIDCTKSL